MDKCIHDDEKICVSEPEQDCQHCSISCRRQIKIMPISGFRHVHGKAFIEAFDKAYNLN